jgi:hypothetical protein
MAEILENAHDESFASQCPRVPSRCVDTCIDQAAVPQTPFSLASSCIPILRHPPITTVTPRPAHASLTSPRIRGHTSWQVELLAIHSVMLACFAYVLSSPADNSTSDSSGMLIGGIPVFRVTDQPVVIFLLCLACIALLAFIACICDLQRRRWRSKMSQAHLEARKRTAAARLPAKPTQGACTAILR